MKLNSRSLFALVVLAPLVLANDPAGDKLEYSPKAGTTLSKHAVIEGEMELEDMKLEVDGQDMSQMAEVQMAVKSETKLSVTDRYEALADGRPTKLVRTFDEVSSSTHISGNNPMAGPQESDIPMASELEGMTVVFTWDGDAYDVAFDGDQKGDESLLEELEENLDLRGFLPTSEVAEGDTWSIPAEAVKTILAPGGDTKLRPDAGGDPMGMDQFSQNDMIGDLTGTFEAAYAGTRENDGSRVAVIKLTIDVRSAQDMTERMGEMKEQMKENMPPGLEFDVSSMDMEYALEAEGELLWNLETGLVASLHMSGEVRMITDMSMDMKIEGQGDKSMEISQTFTGNQTLTLTTGE